MAQPVGPVSSTANYSDNDYQGDWEGGFLFSAFQPILVEITYGTPAASGDIIHDLPCPANQSINLQAPSAAPYRNVFITRVRFKSSGALAATVSGYFNEPRAPGIIAGVSGGAIGSTPLVNLASSSVGVGATFLPQFTLPPQFGGFWLGTSGNLNNIDVLVQTQSATLALSGLVTGDVYGFSGGNAGIYAVPSIGSLVSLVVESNSIQSINLAAVPILFWPPPQFDTTTQNPIFTRTATTIGGGGVDNYVLPAYDGDAVVYFSNTSGSAIRVIVELTTYVGGLPGIGRLLDASVAATTNTTFPLKLSHRINVLRVIGTPGLSYETSVSATPRRGGS